MTTRSLQLVVPGWLVLDQRPIGPFGKKTKGSLQFLINRAAPLLFCLIYKSEAELCRKFPETKTLAIKSFSLFALLPSLSLSPHRVLSLSLPSSRGLCWWPRGVVVARSRLR
ncbi:hypothetical protein YC2023_066542 [Brassica napus]